MAIEELCIVCKAGEWSQRLLDKIKTAAQEEPIAAIGEGVEIAVPEAQQLANFAEAAEVAGQTREIGAEVGAIQAGLEAETAIVQQLATAVAPVTEEINNLRPLFDLKHTMRIPGPHENKYIKIPYSHILTPELMVCPKTGVLKNWSGFHHDYMGRLEQSGFVKIVNKIMGKEGIYSADISIGRFCQLKKTFFPQHWSREKVISKIIEAYENFLAKNIMPEIRRNKYVIYGKTVEGIEIEFYMSVKGEILSAYPARGQF